MSSSATVMTHPSPLPESSKKLILIDGYGFVFRAYHALSRANMHRGDGTPVGAVFAFTNMLMKTVREHPADYIAVVFDAGRKTFRHDLYDAYKANRPPAPDDLIPQFPLVREAARALNLAVVEKEGYEADDLIATYTRIAHETGHEVIIISSDKDLMQLIREGVQMYDPIKAKSIGYDQVMEKFGVLPDKVLDVLSLIGDTSDNVPGVPGIGPKTAAELVNRFGSLDAVLNSTAEITQAKRRQTLEESRDKALLSRDLIRLCSDVPLDTPMAAFLVQPADPHILQAFLREQGFKSILAKIDEKPEAHTTHAPAKAEHLLINNINILVQWIEKQKEIRSISLAIETDTKTEALLGAALCIGGKSAYLPLESAPALTQTSLFGDEPKTAPAQGIKELLIALKPWLEDRSILKIGHEMKSLLHRAREAAVTIAPLDDIMVMSYILEAGLHKHDLNAMLLRHNPLTEDEQFQPNSQTAPEVMAQHACAKATQIEHLHKELRQRLFAQHMLTIYERIEKPLITVLGDMEHAGIRVDTTLLKQMSDSFAGKIVVLEREIYKLSECEFNIGSPKQLGEVLFDKMGLEGGKKSKKTGAYTTDVSVLETLAEEGHPIAQKVLDWRHLSKLKSTYIDSLPKQVDNQSRVHTTFEMALTSTGRLSSHNPNLQNIPVRTEEGNKIREAFVASRGNKLISADYSQIELRLLAHMADIPILQDAFRQNLDIHAATAAQMFGVALEEVDSDLRRKAKTINFGIIYGMSAFGLAERLGISREEAATYIRQYFAQYPGIEAYMKQSVEQARAKGFVETLWGRRCYIPGINDRNGAIRQFSERAAINAPLQGSAADIIKKAMVQLHCSLEEAHPTARILLQVHDELVLEVAEKDAPAVAQLVKQTMENAVSLSVPVTVDVGTGDNWREIH